MEDRLKYRAPVLEDNDEFIDFHYFNAIEGADYKQIGPYKHGKEEQCTGVKDKNDKLIYEGDIIKTKVELDNDYKQIIGPIVLDRLGYKVKTEELGNIPLDVCGLFSNGLEMPKQCDLTEIIGNIHENPELLKECE